MKAFFSGAPGVALSSPAPDGDVFAARIAFISARDEVEQGLRDEPDEAPHSASSG